MVQATIASSFRESAARLDGFTSKDKYNGLVWLGCFHEALLLGLLCGTRAEYRSFTLKQRLCVKTFSEKDVSHTYLSLISPPLRFDTFKTLE